MLLHCQSAGVPLWSGHEVVFLNLVLNINLSSVLEVMTLNALPIEIVL